MHDLHAIYTLCHDVLRAQANNLFDERGDTRHYPNPPKLSDLEVVALAVSAEALGIDSELQLFAHLRDAPDLLPARGSRQRFNARRRGLIDLIDECLASFSAFLDQDGDHLVVDSMPLPTASVKRERRSRACRRPERDAYCADKTYHALLRPVPARLQAPPNRHDVRHLRRARRPPGLLPRRPRLRRARRGPRR